jgi:hypothetical protein
MTLTSANLPDVIGAILKRSSSNQPDSDLFAGIISYSRTAAEIAANVTPSSYAYPTWDVRRMGVVGDGVVDDTAALQRCYTVGGDWWIAPGLNIRCTATITGVIAVRLYSDSAGGLGLGTPSTTLPQAFLIHDFSGTFFDLVGSASSNLISSGFAFERLTFAQKNGNGTGASGVCIRSVQVSNTQKCTWLRITDCNFETLSGGSNDWTYCVQLDGTVSTNPQNLRDIFIERTRFVSGTNATASVLLSGVSNVFLHQIEGNLTKGDISITGSGANTCFSVFMTECSWNNINLDLASGVYGAGNTAATLNSTVNTVDVALGCSCTGTPPTILGTRITVYGKHSTGKWTVTSNNNTRFEMGANTAEHSGPLASDVALQAGTNPATTGVVRLPNASSIFGRNAANSANVEALQVDANNRVRLAPNGADDIVWGRSAIALGGGAAATLGTIGGSGPGTAAQFEWLKVFDTSGNAIFIPVWR